MGERPRWNIAADYVRLKSAGAAYLAWEFLRRNPDYRKDFKTYAAEVVEWAKLHPDLVDATPGALSSSSLFTQRIAFEAHCPERDAWWDRRFKEQWHMHGTFAPEQDDGGEGFMIDAYDNPDQFEPVRLIGGAVHGPKVLIPVDLSEPLQTLEERVMWTVRRLRTAGIKAGTIKARTARARRAQVYIEQLRVVDAVAAGATWPQIGEELAPRQVNDSDERQIEKRLRAKLRAAQKMIAGGYRVLLTDT